MRLVAEIKLQPTEDHRLALLETLERANEAANWLSEIAWSKRVFRRYDLHHVAYFMLRDRFGLSAQMAVRAIAKVADAYKLDRKTKRVFRPRGAIAYDSRILRYHMDCSSVSIWMLAGRVEVPFACGERQRVLLATQKGETDLVFRDGIFYLLAACEVEKPEPYGPESTLGVDLGIVNLATDSTGETFSGERIDRCRQRYDRIRGRLQRSGTRSAKRHLKRIRRREGRFRRQENHVISKTIVAKARRHRAQIALEELKGIRERTTVRKSQRRRHESWAFSQLRRFVSYKAELQGVPLILVDPRKSSQECLECGHAERANRRSRDWFSCKACGHAAPADHKAAQVIAARAAVRRPIVATSENVALSSHVSCKLPAVAVGS